MISPIGVLGKYLDQPILIAKMKKALPYALGGAATVYTANEVRKEPDKKMEKAVKTGIILGVTVASALAAPKIATAITKKKADIPLKAIIKKNVQEVDEFVSRHEKKPILEKAKSKVLSFKEIRELEKTDKKLFDKLIPPPENLSSKDIFSEIGWLSIVGAVPVAGGVAGGIAADAVTGENVKKTLPNKVKEGAYQYLANIFLCNIGAGTALAILEKNNIKSRLARGVGMVAGIILTGVIGGSKIANIIGDKVINPLLGEKKRKQKGDERTPELLDLSLHTDDIATISMLSGLKWIEPALPVFYTVSGYRAGIGYRNHES